MTMKDNKLYVGGHGKESIGRDGQTILNKNYQWIKIITKEVTEINETMNKYPSHNISNNIISPCPLSR